MDKFARRTLGGVLATASCMYNEKRFNFTLLNKPLVQCLATDQDYKNMKNINTNAYVWGDGY